MQKFFCDRPVINPNHPIFPKMGEEILSVEPSLYSNSPTGVRAQGGTLSKLALAFIEEQYAKDISRAEKEGLSAIVDCRVQRLEVGMYPSIPGWHCHAAPRNGYHGQPEFKLVNPAAFHVCVLLSSEHNGVSNTEYVDTRAQFKVWHEEGRSVYKQLHDEVEKLQPASIVAKDGDFVKFTPYTIHRAAPTHRRGWRMFLRFSMYQKPPLNNGLPKQQQVYLISEANGW